MGQPRRAAAAGAALAALVGRAGGELHRRHHPGPDAGRARAPRGGADRLRRHDGAGGAVRRDLGTRQTPVVPPRLPDRAAAGRVLAPGRGAVRAQAAGAGRRALRRDRAVPDDDRHRTQAGLAPLHRVLPLRAPAKPGRRAAAAAPARPGGRAHPRTRARRHRGLVLLPRHRHRARRLPVADAAVVSGTARRRRPGAAGAGLELDRQRGAGLDRQLAPAARRGLQLARRRHDRRLHAVLGRGHRRDAGAGHRHQRLARRPGRRRRHAALAFCRAGLSDDAGGAGVAGYRPGLAAVRAAAGAGRGRTRARETGAVRARGAVEPAPGQPHPGLAGRAGRGALAAAAAVDGRHRRGRAVLVGSDLRSVSGHWPQGMETMMDTRNTGAAARRFRWPLIALAVLALPAEAVQVALGDELWRHGMTIQAEYLHPLEVLPDSPDPSAADAYLQLNIHAQRSNKQGFIKFSWVPYLTVHYRLQSADGRWSREGVLPPTMASYGPNYGANVRFNGYGRYRASFRIEPPPPDQVRRQVGRQTGVGTWWEPIEVQWEFDYLGPGKKTGVGGSGGY
ncbi:hypothetical protein CKO43_23190 [Rubrivivax gelatinosus]|uniref:Uncharacterized protein n=2 Tax=Rubrivivax gelatinosus TaxID=28068 RepID=A0ABS1E1D6_RUBGE|nr:hypothetical protein [Rubrivivax gelatinosus]